ncbi:hypothetical protein ANCDUO_21364 [Ancylostoma duodenale]|uniref:Neurotransmitter-gated ion-channel ligand-binding domain-containing protein n=1 Tax=Ancylostoma duodenale TaxID=51022 RepID=A0A0C2FUI1_9BILA|nr:hypothetical protein ANCDUO_21364 [Ancylostoma duodenale]
MDLSKFPMDTIECILTFESFNYNKEEVHMRWSDSPLIQYKDIELPDFSMLYAAGYWDELTVTFVFRRRYGWYLLQGKDFLVILLLHITITDCYYIRICQIPL